MGEKGVLLPVSCLAGFGDKAYRFVDWMSQNHYHFWEVLPLNPRDDCGSPYNSHSSLTIDPNYGTLKQWLKLKKYANDRKIKIIGDLPFFVSKNSIEYQKYKKFFLTDQFSGAPPDYYTKKGQFWGHPQYNWEALEKDNFRFFFQRLEIARGLFDIVRLDHFRGYHAVWSIPKKYHSGRKGQWVLVPGEKLFKILRQKYPGEIFIAENLGHMTPGVEDLRQKFGFLGSAIIQFGENNAKDIVYYTSNHDSETLAGRFGKNAPKYLQKVLESPAKIKIIPMWDLLGLGNKARFNKPGTKKGNWQWKLPVNYFELVASQGETFRGGVGD